MSDQVICPKIWHGCQRHGRRPDQSTVWLTKCKTCEFKAAAPELITMTLPPFIKALPTRHAPVSGVGRHTASRCGRQGRRRSPFADRKRNTFVSTMRRQGREDRFPHLLTSQDIHVGEFQPLDLYMSATKNQLKTQPLEDYVPVQNQSKKGSVCSQ